MAGITVQSSLSGASGIAVAIALIRGFARRTSSTVGNFWTDMTRITLYVLLPVCIVATLLLVWQGVPQTLGSYVDATTLEGPRQVLARGPVASQEAIKLLSGDGGGFFNANSAHPFENPTALTGLFEPLLIFLIGVALTNTFGRIVGDPRQGWTLFAALTLAAAMFAGRFLVIVPVLCIAGTVAAKRRVPVSAGTLPTHGTQFVTLLVGTIVIVGGLTFLRPSRLAGRGTIRHAGWRHVLNWGR